jgi:hypothetical protein
VSDGASVTDVNTAGAAAVTPNVDMISEAKVETSAFSAVQPSGPIVFETQTKSGGSQYHGEAYFTVRNHIFDATDAYTKELGLPKANSSFYYPGFNIGGPSSSRTPTSTRIATSSSSSLPPRSPSSTWTSAPRAPSFPQP